MYFCYQSENAFISYVIVFWQAGHATLLPSVCCFVRHSVCSALSALSPTQEPVFNFLPSNCLLFKYLLCIEHSETTNIAREQALLFGRAKRAACERASGEALARVLFTKSPKWRACSQATTNIARWTGGTQSTKRERPLRTSVLRDKDHIAVDGKGYSRGPTEISPVIMRPCLLANTKSQKLMLVNFESCRWLHLGIKFTFFVALDTSQSIKREHFWGRFWGGVIGSLHKPIRSDVPNSHQTLPSLNTDRSKEDTQGKVLIFSLSSFTTQRQ